MNKDKRFWLVPVDYYGEQRFVRDNSLIGEKSLSNEEVVDLLNNQDKQIRKLENELELYKYYMEFLPSSEGDVGMISEDFRASEQSYCPREKVSKSITQDKLEVSAITLRLIEANVLEEVLEVLEENNASPILIGKVKLALR